MTLSKKKLQSKEFHARRLRLKLTRAELAERWGLHRHTVWNWERGATPVPKWALLLIELWAKYGY